MSYRIWQQEKNLILSHLLSHTKPTNWQLSFTKKKKKQTLWYV